MKWILKYQFNTTKIYNIEDCYCYKIIRGNLKISNILSEQRMKQITLFIMGYKPAVWFQIKEEIIINNSVLKKYPHILLENSIILFQKQESLEIFKEHCLINNECINKFNFNHEIMGRLLGFPPYAVKDFLKLIHSNYENWIGLDYYGICFGLYKKSKKVCLDWLNSNYTIPQDIKDNFGLSYIF